MRLRHVFVGLGLLALTLLSGCYCGRSCGYPAGYGGGCGYPAAYPAYRPCCPPAVSAFPASPACPCNGNGNGVSVQAFSGGPPIVTNPHHP